MGLQTLPISAEAGEWEGFHLGPLRIGGAFRVNFIYKDWDEEYQDPGELAFDTARLNLDLEKDALIGSLEYRYYREKHSGGHDYSMLHHGWLGWRFGEGQEAHLGVSRVPFGILPYASHSWFSQIAYYVGLEDDYDLGAKYLGQWGSWDFRAAWFLRSESLGHGDSDDSARYSYDLVREGTEGNRERNQFNLRLARNFGFAAEGTVELGVSFQYGQVPNDNTDERGDQLAVAAHLDGNWGRWNLMLQAVRYRYDVENDPELDASADGSFVVMGAFDAAYHVASEADIYSVGLSYTLPVRWGPVTALTFYDDYSVLRKREEGFVDSTQNVLGCSVSAGMFLVYIDLATGKNHPWLGGDWTDGLAGGVEGDGRHTRFNINFGFYF